MTIHLKAKVEAGGKPVVDGVPFPEGQEVEISINPVQLGNEDRYPLKGTVYRFDDPFSPAVPPGDWEAGWNKWTDCGKKASRERFDQILSSSPDVPPIPGDEIGS